MRTEVVDLDGLCGVDRPEAFRQAPFWQPAFASDGGGPFVDHFRHFFRFGNLAFVAEQGGNLAIKGVGDVDVLVDFS